MSHYPKSIRDAIKRFSRLPGIGEKSAERLVMHILRSSAGEARELARCILELKDNIRLCTRCFSLSDGELCDICSNSNRDPSLLCVVEHPAEMVAIEKSGAFFGVYHVLQGVLSPMNGIGPDDIRIKELMTRIAEGGVREVVLALGMHVEGEATVSYIAEHLNSCSVKLSRIASGVPVGGELKYVDQVTLKRAMECRHVL